MMSVTVHHWQNAEHFWRAGVTQLIEDIDACDVE